jgi:hypothetical protein
LVDFPSKEFDDLSFLLHGRRRQALSGGAKRDEAARKLEEAMTDTMQ